VERKMIFSRVQDFISDAMYETNVEVLKSTLSKYINPLGFDMHTCVSIVDLTNPPPSALLILDFPKPWVERYIEQNYIEKDVIFRKAVRDMQAFKWQDVSYDDNMSHQIFDEAGEFGIKNGVTVPINLPGYYPATVNIIGENCDVSDEDYHAIHLISVYYYNAIIRIQKSKYADDFQEMDLAPRERECLHWVAQGKSDTDIGDILFLSPHTVHSYVESAKRKLHVSTRTQAAVRAVFCGLIVP
tara:strand:+ start:35 stop:763 length:729 start_codon:yes stop_codon:yes gene_type:complete